MSIDETGSIDSAMPIWLGLNGVGKILFETGDLKGEGRCIAANTGT